MRRVLTTTLLVLAMAELKVLLQQAHPVPVRGGKAEPGTKAKFSN
ncbi:MAG: hypothetical protein NT167_22770 [Verrucomicrobia bacterium]|nr:hypothetical protein [Verrucomicrobiota bacterium]